LCFTEDIAAWTSCAAAKRGNKEREKFGKGSIEGLMSAETGESACVPGAIASILWSVPAVQQRIVGLFKRRASA
jgi:TctA family transporter